MKATASSLPARLNPFAAHRVEQIPYRFPEGDWPSSLDRLSRLGFRAAIVGPHGSGKTTLLEQLAGRLRDGRLFRGEVRHLFLARDPESIGRQLSKIVSALDREICWLVDGFERLKPTGQRHLLDNCPHGLVVTAHRPCQLPVWVRTASSRVMLDHLLEQLGLPDNPVVRSLSDQAFRGARGNLREALRILYDRAGELA